MASNKLTATSEYKATVTTEYVKIWREGFTDYLGRPHNLLEVRLELPEGKDVWTLAHVIDHSGNDGKMDSAAYRDWVIKTVKRAVKDRTVDCEPWRAANTFHWNLPRGLQP